MIGGDGGGRGRGRVELSLNSRVEYGSLRLFVRVSARGRVRGWE